MAHGAASSPTTRRSGVLAEVERSLYMPYPAEGHSYWVALGYSGPQGLDRYEIRTLQIQDDVYQDAMIRSSADNGRTWSSFVPYTERRLRHKQGWAREPYIMHWCYDPAAKRMVRTILMRTHQGDPTAAGIKTYYDHTLWQTSADNGRTWDAPRLLRYEAGAEYDPERFDDDAFLQHNQAYSGYTLIPLTDGRIATAICLPVTLPNEQGQSEKVTGAACCMGRWNPAAQTYDWTCASPVAVTRQVSDRGLLEPWIAQLANGNLFVVMRGNATAANPGRHFYTLSKDDGKTWSAVRDLRYDDGGQFFAPSSMSVLIRHSRTGRLYWFGNISPQPSSGNSPRYPLYMAEIDETQPAIKRATLTVLDDYDPAHQTPAIQFSNFSIVENRETGAFEMTMTFMGEYPNVYTANVYWYVIRLKT